MKRACESFLYRYRTKREFSKGSHLLAMAKFIRQLADCLYSFSLTQMFHTIPLKVNNFNRMKHLNVFLPIIGIMTFLSSCNGDGGFLSSSGTANEVLVVMEKNQWESETGKALFDVLNSPVKGLPQPEPNFRILHIIPENFSSTFKMVRNIIIPEISTIYSSPKLSSEIDKYATGQVVMTVQAPDTTSFIQFLTENTESIINYLVRKELERTARWLTRESKSPNARIQEVFGVDIRFPKGLTNVTEYENFYWATNNTPRLRQDVAVYQFPYTTETVFEKDSLIAIRNRVLGQHITGVFDSEMSTAVHAYDPDYRRIEIDGLFRAELRGLWEMTNDMMGGPFVMHAFVNENTNMVVIVDVFVFAPESNKRNTMRTLESSLYTIEIPESGTEE